MGVLEIFDVCPEDISLVSSRYFNGVLETFIGVLEIFNWCPGDILFVSWRYFIGVLEILDTGPGDILWGVLDIFVVCP